MMIAAASVGVMGASTAAQAGTTIAVSAHASVPTLVPVFTAFITLSPPVEYGISEGVKRRLIPIMGGTFEGKRIKGTILSGGGDWQNVAADGTAHIFAR
jgi:hypothetical protein